MTDKESEKRERSDSDWALEVAVDEETSGLLVSCTGN